MIAEHTISYSYPSSVHAAQAGFAKTGCYTFQSDNHFEGFLSLDEAKRAAIQLQTVPGRWSIDHPANAQFLKHFQ